MSQLVVAQLSHHYSKQRPVLEDVSFSIERGEFFCLLGASGCGKTTLLHALAGQIRCSSGNVSFQGSPVTGPDPSRLLMFQDPALFPWLTAESNILFALGGKGLPKSERRERAHYFIHRVKLAGFERYYPHQLSGGMKMRVSLARALAMDPAILLMDEPFASLDALTRAQMHQLLHQIWSETGKTIVLVTHDVHEAVTLGTRVAVMTSNPGQILREFAIPSAHPRDADDPRFLADASTLRGLLRSSKPMQRSVTADCPITE